MPDTPDQTPLTWRVTWPDEPRTHATDGACCDGVTSVGRVYASDNSSTRGWWTWTMYATGHGGPAYHLCRGVEREKDVAKAKVEEAWRDLCAADPDNWQRWIDHKALVRRGAEMWARRGGNSS